MSWQKKHFEAVAKVLRDTRTEAVKNYASPSAFTALDAVTDKFTALFIRESPTFDTCRFSKAAGYKT